jgi:RNA polymerase sigma-70 factor (ECF subfamily)
MPSVTDCTNDTDEQVIARVSTEREVFGYIIDRYEDKLRRYLRRLMPGLAEDTDDLLQDIFVKVYINAHGFDTSLKFSSWIYRIAHNEAVSWLRKKKVRPDTVELGDDEFTTFIESAEIARDFKESRLAKDEVMRVLGEMSEKYRTVLVLRFLEGKNYEEIGDILTVPGGTVATLIHRAKKEFSNIYTSHHAVRS